ncbi:MAG TPA: sulfatase-like hydrolase/transferase, partial [Verrucomicrobiae bacterium]|nr:sulfatase-like hydrolase/transferase [Verrucomicrobiae bacterium]
GKNVLFGGMANHLKVPVRDLGPDGKLTPERVGEKFSSELFADAAIDFLKKQDGSKPFFAYVAFTAPHDPRMPPVPIREYYYQHKPPLPVNFAPQFPFDNGHILNCRDEGLAAWPRTEPVIRDQLAEYYGMITHMDGQIGRILDTLKKTGLADNTIIIYSADNGLTLGSHGLMGKQNLFEESMRVPLIMAGPGIPVGKSTSALTYMLDVFPTVCDLTGVKAPGDLEGETLRPLWEGKKEKIRDSIFLPFLKVQRGVLDERWKLIAYPDAGVLQLFDLQKDPYELSNLVDKPQFAGQKSRLLKLMKNWQAKVGDTVKVNEENKPYKPMDLTGHKRTPDKFQPDWIVKKYF